MVSEWPQHCDEAIVLVCQRKDTEFVNNAPSVGDSGEQPVKVVFVDTLREEGNDPKKPPGIRAEFFECRGGKRKLNGGSKTLGVVCVKYTCSLFPPFCGQSLGTPLVVMCNGGKQGD